MNSNDLFERKLIPQQFVSVVPSLTASSVDAINDAVLDSKQQKHAHKEMTCSLCQTTILTKKYYRINGKPIHDYCYKSLTGPFCNCCSRPIIGCDSISCLGKQYHPGCLRCSVCQANIGANEKVESYKGIPVCCECYSQRCKVCPVCKTIVSKGGLKLLFEGKLYHLHKECARCQECSEDVTQKNFACEHGEVLCRNCWFNIADFICVECGEAITPNDRVSFNGYRHSKCFHCHNCNANLINSEPEIVGDMLLCKRCLTGIDTHCAVCLKEIKGREKVEMFGRVFHQKCYKCIKCKKILHNDEAIFKKGNIICHKCASKK